jgi:hypothetical protein
MMEDARPMTRARAAGAPGPAQTLPQRFATSVVAREVLRDVAGILAGEGITVMPLKGVLFQLVLYSDAAERALLDVDVLVPRRSFGRAIHALTSAGFRPRSASLSLIECALWSPRGLLVDLHRQLFSRGRYRLSTDALFRRATRDDRLLGVPLQLAHPHDTAAHLIGKFVADHEGSEPLRRLQELAFWARHCGIDPWRLARHLSGCGMLRAARYTFQRGIELSADPFFGAALGALPADPLGRATARLARALISELGPTPLGALPAHLLNRSLASGGVSLACSALERLHHAWLSRREGAGAGHWSPFFGPEATASAARRRRGRLEPRMQRITHH